MSKKIITLHTGLFDVDPVVAGANQVLPQSKSIDLQKIDLLIAEDWDAIMLEILGADQIVTI